MRVVADPLAEVWPNTFGTGASCEEPVLFDLDERDEVEATGSRPTNAVVVPKACEKPQLVAWHYARQVGGPYTQDVTVSERLEFRICVCTILPDLLGKKIGQGSSPARPQWEVVVASDPLCLREPRLFLYWDELKGAVWKNGAAQPSFARIRRVDAYVYNV